MSKLKTLYDLMQPSLKSRLKANARKYDSAKRLKYKLMSNTLWSDLSLNDISDILTYSDLYTADVTAKDVLYGRRFLTDKY